MRSETGIEAGVSGVEPWIVDQTRIASAGKKRTRERRALYNSF